MRPPFFVWRSGTLDVCDSPEELSERYPTVELAQANVVVCDSRGHALWISRAARGAWQNAVEGPQRPSPGLLRSIVWPYLESCGMRAEEVQSLSLDELVRRVCPPDPLPEQGIKDLVFGHAVAAGFGLVCFAGAMMIEWLQSGR